MVLALERTSASSKVGMAGVVAAGGVAAGVLADCPRSGPERGARRVALASARFSRNRLGRQEIGRRTQGPGQGSINLNATTGSVVHEGLSSVGRS